MSSSIYIEKPPEVFLSPSETRFIRAFMLPVLAKDKPIKILEFRSIFQWKSLAFANGIGKYNFMVIFYMDVSRKEAFVLWNILWVFLRIKCYKISQDQLEKIQ